MKTAIIIFSIFFCIQALGYSATLKVPSQYPKIQDAIDASVNGDTVLVWPGTYVENIDFIGKAITLTSEQGANITVIDGNQAGSVVTCKNGEGPDSVLNGFTVTNGFAPPKGGGMDNSGSSPTVNYCAFSGNSTHCGGGMYNWDNSNPIVTNCTFAGNWGILDGGGMLNSNCSPKVTNCTFIGNRTWEGGGMYNNGGGSPTVTNCILWDNTPDAMINLNSSPTVTYSCVQGGFPFTGNIDSDPLVVELGYWDDNGTPGKVHDDIWVDGDFHLTFNSPCRGSGDNTAVTEPYDFEGDPRIAYGTVDMGADEFYTHLYWTGDATPGGNVEIKFVGLPGTTPVGLCIGTGVLDPPLKSMWGDWYLKFPIIGPIGMPQIPSEGVLIIPATIPASPPAPYSLPMQALIGAELSNLSVMEIK